MAKHGSNQSLERVEWRSVSNLHSNTSSQNYEALARLDPFPFLRERVGGVGGEMGGRGGGGEEEKDNRHTGRQGDKGGGCGEREERGQPWPE